jgi:hypothetical protein
VDLSAADLVWNRACSEPGGAQVGDRLLRALLGVHNMIMNGGPNHAVDMCLNEDIAAAEAACIYFGLDDVAVVISRIPEAADDEQTEMGLDDAYDRLVPSDETLADAFRHKLIESAADFDPLPA